MIAALVNAGIILDEPSWLEIARRAFDFIAQAMTKDDRLGHSWRAGKLLFPGLASDFAAMIRAALALYEATGERGCLEHVLSWQNAFDAHYGDADTGSYYLSADDATDLLLRPHSTADDATPNPNAVAAQNLVRLAVLAGSNSWRGKGRPPDRRYSFGGRAQSVRSCRAAQRARPASARGGNRRDWIESRRLRSDCTEIALPRSHRPARRDRQRSAARAPGARKVQSRIRQCGLRLCRRTLLIAGNRTRTDRRNSRSNARILIHPLKGG